MNLCITFYFTFESKSSKLFVKKCLIAIVIDVHSSISTLYGSGDDYKRESPRFQHTLQARNVVLYSCKPYFYHFIRLQPTAKKI